jgi:hypothetical protein
LCALRGGHWDPRRVCASTRGSRPWCPRVRACLTFSQKAGLSNYWSDQEQSWKYLWQDRCKYFDHTGPLEAPYPGWRRCSSAGKEGREPVELRPGVCPAAARVHATYVRGCHGGLIRRGPRGPTPSCPCAGRPRGGRPRGRRPGTCGRPRAHALWPVCGVPPLRHPPLERRRGGPWPSRKHSPQRPESLGCPGGRGP